MLKEKMQSIIDKANSVTGKVDKNLTDSTRSLIEGYGKTDDTTITEICDGAKVIVNHTAKRIPDWGGFTFMKATSISFTELTYLGSSAFYACDKLTQLILPKCEILMDESVEYEKALPRISLPAAREIYDYAFYGDKALETVVLPGSTVCKLMAAPSGAFGDTPILSGTGYIYVPRALIDQYKAASNWSEIASQFRAIEDYPGIDAEEYPGLSASYVATSKENYNAMMAEAGGSADHVPFILHTDPHGRVASDNHVFDIIQDMTDWNAVSAIVGLGDVVYSNYNLPELSAYSKALRNIPKNKRIEVYGNHDTWQMVDGHRDYTLDQTLLAPYFPNRAAEENSLHGYFVTLDKPRRIKYLAISPFEYTRNIADRRISTAQADFLVRELSKNDGYDIILLSHQPLDASPDWITRDPTAELYTETFLSDLTANQSLLDMVKARHDFTSGTFVDSEGNQHPYDFSGLKTKLLAQFAGHAHFEAHYQLPGSITEIIYDWFDKNTFYFGYLDRKGMKLKIWKNEVGVPALEISLT